MTPPSNIAANTSVPRRGFITQQTRFIAKYSNSYNPDSADL